MDPMVAVAGMPVMISGTVQNQGNRLETFDVNAFAGSILVGTQTVSNLAASESEIVSFTWDTSTFDAGLYPIRVEIVPLSAEEDLADNGSDAGTVVLAPSITGL